MKKEIVFLALFLVLALAFAIAGESFGQGKQGKPAANSSQTDEQKKIRLKFSPDQVYKANCTRCHSEIPKLDERRTRTIIRHMRVRANLTQDEGQAILEYMTK